jgi:hypothetical protein
MAQSDWLTMLLLVLCCGAAVGAQSVRCQETAGQKEGHQREYWKNVVKSHYSLPSGAEAFPLARELSGYLGSPDPELRDTLAYAILYTWIVDQKKLSPAELLTLSPG